MRALRRLLPAALAIALVGCGTGFPLPTENRVVVPLPGDGSYQMKQTWKGLNGIRDVLLTQGTGSQLFLLFNNDDTGDDNPNADTTLSRGEVAAYYKTRNERIPGYTFRGDRPGGGLFNPVALCAGGDGAGSPGNRIFVLDRGDTAVARDKPKYPPFDTLRTSLWNRRVARPQHYWRVREYRLLGGDTLSTFTDTTMAWVNGIAADADGNVYVSGVAIIYLPNQSDPRLTNRVFQYRIFKYAHGASPPDVNMPGSQWHRAADFAAEEGSGIGYVTDPRGIFWTPLGGGALFTSDFGKNWVQKLYDRQISTGYFKTDVDSLNQPFSGPIDVTADLAGYFYFVDSGNQRVLRYQDTGGGAREIQRVDVEPNDDLQPLLAPVAIGADDSLAYVADRGRAQVLYLQRRK
jgi:hypothetical protein